MRQLMTEPRHVIRLQTACKTDREIGLAERGAAMRRMCPTGPIDTIQGAASPRSAAPVAAPVHLFTQDVRCKALSRHHTPRRGSHNTHSVILAARGSVQSGFNEVAMRACGQGRSV